MACALHSMQLKFQILPPCTAWLTAWQLLFAVKHLMPFLIGSGGPEVQVMQCKVMYSITL